MKHLRIQAFRPECEYPSDNGLSAIKLPAPLYRAFKDLARREGIGLWMAFRLVVCGLWGLSAPDIRSLPEPPLDYCGLDPEIDLEIELEWTDLKKLSKATRIAQMSDSSVFRRVLYALLITHEADCIVAGHDAFCILLTGNIPLEFRKRPDPTMKI